MGQAPKPHAVLFQTALNLKPVDKPIRFGNIEPETRNVITFTPARVSSSTVEVEFNAPNGRPFKNELLTAAIIAEENRFVKGHRITKAES